MTTSSENFTEQFLRIQQQFKDCTQFEQLYIVVELTRTFQSSYQHFLIQLFQAHIQRENNDMFNHTVDDANASDIVSCLLSNSLDKILFTIQLYLPLISAKPCNDKLLDAYRDVLIHLDANLCHLNQSNYSEQQIINFSQQILFFIQTNPYLKPLSSHIPQIIKLVQTNKLPTDNQSYHPSLTRTASATTTRTQIQPLMTFSSEGLQNSILSHPLTHHDTNDSGVDLNEPPMFNSKQNFLTSLSHQQSLNECFNRTSPSSASMNKHSFVAKTASSPPIPEHAELNIQTRTPLKCVLSAPPPSTTYSDYRNRNLNSQQQLSRTVLTKSDEEEEESQQQTNDLIENSNSITDNRKPLSRLCAYHTYPAVNRVSQYLGVDGSGDMPNTFKQANTGMKDVPKWLKHLRLHKYDIHFSQMTYDKMMNLTNDELKQLNVTDGARAKILLNIKKLKERSMLLKQYIAELDNPSVDLQNYILQLNEILITPIRSKQLEQENNVDEDIPSLIMQLLEKIYQQVTPNSSADIGNSLLGLFDRCYRHEAFTDNQRYIILQWRGRVSNMLQSLGRIEYKTIQSALNHSSSTRRGSKTPLKHYRSVASYQNPLLNSVPLAKYKSEPQNNNFSDSNSIRRPNRSPPLSYPTNEESNDMYLQTSFSSLSSTPQRNNATYLATNNHQTLTRKASIGPYDESNSNGRTKLCKTFSGPGRIRFQNPTQGNQLQLSTPGVIKAQSIQQQHLYRMISTPYSQQPPRHFMSRSPPTSNTMDMSSSPINNMYSDNEKSDYYGNNDINVSFNDTSNINDLDTSDYQRNQSTEIESLCRRVTETAMGDDVTESSIDHSEEHSSVSNLKQSSNNSTDTEQ